MTSTTEWNGIVQDNLWPHNSKTRFQQLSQENIDPQQFLQLMDISAAPDTEQIQICKNKCS